MSEPYYRVEVDAGPYSWVTTNSDAAAYGLADPLTVSWKLPEDGRLMPHPPPLQATFRVVVADFADVADLATGDPVVIRMYAYPPGTLDPDLAIAYPPLVTFRGTVGQPTADTHGLGMVLTVPCTGYDVAELAEKDVGLVDWPAESAIARLARISTEAGLPASVYNVTYSSSALVGINLAARPAARSDALSEIIRVLTECVIWSDTEGYGLTNLLAPLYSAGTHYTADTPDAGQPFVARSVVSLEDVSSSGGGGIYPGRFADVGGGLWGITIAMPTAFLAAGKPRIFDAGLIKGDASWALLKADQADTVTVTTSAGTFDTTETYVQQVGVDPLPIRLAIDTDLTAAANARALGKFELRTRDSDRWTADEFTYLADRDPRAALYPLPLFNDAFLYVVPYRHAALNEIDPIKNPSGLDWYAGMISGARLTLAKGRYQIGVQLRRTLRKQNDTPGNDPDSASELCWGNVTDTGSNPTWAQLSPDYSWYDYRVARNPAYA